ncbi:c-type cytochrome [Paracrocinitomix mangrovi]|uniref:c-type cytochrome n=1 Tax=Paracrocinitomix mangrovi TaxID=2862509 RepID=UPI001C8D0475|nr:c-type cytochrome [Paracrocinitomix mangrovi]UKN00734.1 c-type cytochrome [Paracrocinitomix mangrovi]
MSDKNILSKRNWSGLLIVFITSLIVGIYILLAPSKTSVKNSTQESIWTKIEPIEDLETELSDFEKGKSLFKEHCAACHFVDRDMTGPALKGARQRWIDNSTEKNFYQFIKSMDVVVMNGDEYANYLFKLWGVAMTPQNVTNEEIDLIFIYVEDYGPVILPNQ